METLHQAITQALATNPSSPSIKLTPTTGTNPEHAVAVIAQAKGLARRLLLEISLRWPGQAQWAKDEAYIDAWGRALAEQSRPPAWPALLMALGTLSSRPYPPSVGAVIAQVAKMEEVLTPEEARAAMRDVDRAAATGSWWKLLPQVWQALHSFAGGSARIHRRDEVGPGAVVLEDEWRAALSDAIKHPDREIIERQPRRPAALLAPSDEEKARRAAVASENIKKIEAVLRRGSSE